MYSNEEKRKYLLFLHKEQVTLGTILENKEKGRFFVYSADLNFCIGLIIKSLTSDEEYYLKPSDLKNYKKVGEILHRKSADAVKHFSQFRRYLYYDSYIQMGTIIKVNNLKLLIWNRCNDKVDVIMLTSKQYNYSNAKLLQCVHSEDISVRVRIKLSMLFNQPIIFKDMKMGKEFQVEVLKRKLLET